MKKSVFKNRKPKAVATATLDGITRLQAEAEREFAQGNRHLAADLTKQASARLESFRHRQEPGRRSIWTA